MSGYYPATYGFENDDDGSAPTGWDVFEGAGSVNVMNEMNDHKKVVELYDNTNANHDELHDSFSLQTSGTIEFWVLSDDVAQTFSIILLDDTATGVWGNGIGWLQIYQNKFRYEDTSGWHDTTKTLYDNTWYHVEVEFECTTGNYHGLSQDTWRFYIDGEQFGDFSFAHNINNVSQVYFATRGADNNYRCYVDAVGYSWDSAYTIDDNAQEGILLSFNTVFAPDWLGYSLDGLGNKTILGNVTFPMPSEGLHTIQVFGNDSLGTMYNSNLRYFITSTPPLIEINSPNLDEYFGPLAPNFNVSIIDSDLNSTWFTLDGGVTNITFFSFIDTINQAEWDKLGDGIFIIRFYANDSDGLFSYTEVTVRKDIETPIIISNSPNYIDLFGLTAPSFNISINDPNLDSMWYSLDGGITNITFYNFIHTINQTEWDKLGNGTIIIRFYVNDSWGLFSYTEVTVRKGLDTPIIKINSPSSTDIFGFTAPVFNLSIIEATLNETWYTLDNGVTNIPFIGLTGSINQTVWDKHDEGLITIRFYANNTLGVENYKEVIVIKDTTAPMISFNIPYENEFFAGNSPSFNITIDDVSLNSTWYTIDNGVNNITFIGLTGTINQTEWDKQGEGPVIVRFCAKDSYGYQNYSEIILHKDITDPVLTIFSPTTGDRFTTIPPAFNIDVDELNIERIWYTIDGGLNNYDITQFTSYIDSSAWNVAPLGAITIRFSVEDKAGNLVYTDIIIQKSTPPPPPPPLNINLIIIIAVIAFIGITILEGFVYRKKHVRIKKPKPLVERVEKSPKPKRTKRTKTKKGKKVVERLILCPYCQGKIPENQKYCYYCGSKLVE